MNTSFQKTAGSDEWYTPREIIDALGTFDLDPCAPERPLWPTAREMWDKRKDGLAHPWGGVRVWLNPPYSQPLLTRFATRMAENGNGIMLTFARVDNSLFQDLLLPSADAVLFLRHRIRFFRPDGTQGDSAGSGSCLLAWGAENCEALERSGLEGVYVPLEGARKTTKTIWEK